MNTTGQRDTANSTQELVDKALSRSNLSRTEQRRIGHALKDALILNTFQAKTIREMKEEIIRLKICNTKILNAQERNIVKVKTLDWTHPAPPNGITCLYNQVNTCII